MSEHLSTVTLSALVDGELSCEQLADAQAHLAECSACTSNALGQSLLKSASARAGRRYMLPAQLETRLSAIAKHENVTGKVAPPRSQSSGKNLPRFAALAAALTLLVGIGGITLLYRTSNRAAAVSAQSSALIAEVCDQHIATLAVNSPPQVISSDRHTVKPWFQGKLPFSFNLPENLPADTKLEGADLTYIHGQPAAQLLYSIGKHRVSVFVTQRTNVKAVFGQPRDHAGFHVAGFNTRDLDAIAVSDVDPGRLSGLVGLIFQAQDGVTSPSN
jgi:anti-sigma factor RsiW